MIVFLTPSAPLNLIFVSPEKLFFLLSKMFFFVLQNGFFLSPKTVTKIDGGGPPRPRIKVFSCMLPCGANIVKEFQ